MAKFGIVKWTDLTVDNADELKDFYTSVIGWESEGLDMGGYDDYVMKTDEGGVAGVCHRRGPNEKIPPYWLIYVTVENLIKSLQQVNEKGGKVIDGPRKMGDSSFAIIQDPAGAYMALYQE